MCFSAKNSKYMIFEKKIIKAEHPKNKIQRKINSTKDVKTGKTELSEIDLVNVIDDICNSPWDTFEGYVEGYNYFILF